MANIHQCRRSNSYKTVHRKKKPCRNAPNSDADNGGAEPKDVEVGIFRPPRRLVRATVVHIGITLFLQCIVHSQIHQGRLDRGYNVSGVYRVRKYRSVYLITEIFLLGWYSSGR